MSTEFYTWALHSVLKVDRFFRPIWRHGENDQYKNTKVLSVLLVGGYITIRLAKKIIIIKQKYDTKKKIKEKQEECKLSKENLEKVLKDRKMSTEIQGKIVSLSFNELQKELQSGKLTAVDVLHAYQIKAIEVDKRLNCVTDVVREAEEMALDRDLNARKKGPLYGIPISVKETYPMPGYPCTGGMAFFLDETVTEENILLQVLKKQGAVPFVRTNVPQTLMTFECSNTLYGTTVNPYDPTRVPGGSSGGEAALISGGGSILGMGGDIGGSVRISAHMCGCCAIKPTGGRISRKGQNKFNRGQILVRAQTGLMAVQVDALVTCMKSLLVPEMFKLDPTVPPIPFRDEIDKQKRKLTMGFYRDDGTLKSAPACQRAVLMAKEAQGHTIYQQKRNLTIGFYIDDGNLKSAPACQRAVLEVKAILEAQGHTLVSFEPLDIYRMATLFLRAVFADGGKSYVDVLQTDIIHPSIRRVIFGFSLPVWFRKFAGYLAKLITKDQFMKILLHAGTGVKSISEYWDLAMEIKQYRSDFLKKWRDNRLDACICPGFAFPAVPSGKVTNVAGGVTYTILYNVLEYPVGTLKVTNVTQPDVDNFKDYPSNTWMEKYMKEYSKGSVGLPVGVQFVSLPFEDEQVLRLMKDVESSLGQ